MIEFKVVLLTISKIYLNNMGWIRIRLDPELLPWIRIRNSENSELDPDPDPE